MYLREEKCELLVLNIHPHRSTLLENYASQGMLPGLLLKSLCFCLSLGFLTRHFRYRHLFQKAKFSTSWRFARLLGRIHLCTLFRDTILSSIGSIPSFQFDFKGSNGLILHTTNSKPVFGIIALPVDSRSVVKHFSAKRAGLSALRC